MKLGPKVLAAENLQNLRNVLARSRDSGTGQVAFESQFRGEPPDHTVGSPRACKYCLCSNDVGGIEPFGEPANNGGKDLTCHFWVLSLEPDLGEIRRGSQLPQLRILLSRFIQA